MRKHCNSRWRASAYRTGVSQSNSLQGVPGQKGLLDGLELLPLDRDRALGTANSTVFRLTWLELCQLYFLSGVTGHCFDRSSVLSEHDKESWFKVWLIGFLCFGPFWKVVWVDGGNTKISILLRAHFTG